MRRFAISLVALSLCITLFQITACNDKKRGNHLDEIDSFTWSELDTVRYVINSGEFEIYTDKSSLSPVIVQYITDLSGGEFPIANPDEAYNPTDVILPDDKRYRQKMYFILRKDNLWIMSWSRGGIGTSSGITLFEVKDKAVIRTVVAYSKEELLTPTDLKEALDRANYFHIVGNRY